MVLVYAMHMQKLRKMPENTKKKVKVKRQGSYEKLWASGNLIIYAAYGEI